MLSAHLGKVQICQTCHIDISAKTAQLHLKIFVALLSLKLMLKITTHILTSQTYKEKTASCILKLHISKAFFLA